MYICMCFLMVQNIKFKVNESWTSLMDLVTWSIDHVEKHASDVDMKC